MDGGLLEQVEAAIDELAALVVDDLDDPTVHDAVVALGTLSNRLEAVWCGLIGGWDRRRIWADNGSKAAWARLARETGMRNGDAKRLVARSRDLNTMPHTAEAYRAGELTGAHVDLIASCDRPWRNTCFVNDEQLLVDSCRTPFFRVATAAVEHWKLLADRDADHDGADPAVEGRRASCSTTFQGQVVVDATLDPVGGEVFKTELERIYERLRLNDLRDGVERSAAQRRADALVEMATRSATAPADGLRPRPLITVTVGIEHFNWMCHTATGTTVAPDLLIPLLGDADIERIVYDPPNRRIEASHRQSFTGAIRRIIQQRDQHCQHPSGCDEPAIACDVDHITPRSRGGITCLCNGQLLCKYHNRILKAQQDRQSRQPGPPTGNPHPCPYPDHHQAWTPTGTDTNTDGPARAPPTSN